MLCAGSMRRTEPRSSSRAASMRSSCSIASVMTTRRPSVFEHTDLEDEERGVVAKVASKQGGRAEGEWPTQEMVAAGLRRMLSDKQYSAPWEDVIYNMFRDMLAAAPEAKPQGDSHE